MPTKPRSAAGAQRPPKPYESFPLFPHAKGYWCKKVDGRQESFGRWAWPDRAAYDRSWRAALDAFKAADEARARGVALLTRGDRIEIETLVDAFLTHKERQSDKRQVTARMFVEYATALKGFRESVGGRRTVADLEGDPRAIQAYCDGLDGRLGWHAYNKQMVLVRAMFRWAAEPLGGDILPRPFRLLGLFKKRSEKHLRRDKRLHVAEHGNAYLPPAEVRLMVDAAPTPAMRAQVLLGYYAAYGNTDCSDLPQNAIDRTPDPAIGLPSGWAVLHFPRPKTEVDRAAVVPPEVVAALDEAIAARPDPAQPDRWDHLVFLTRHGLPYVRDLIRRDDEDGGDGGIEAATHIDSISMMYRKLRQRVGTCPDRHAYEADAGPACCLACRAARPDAVVELRPVRTIGFYALRHTAITAASGAADVDVLSRWQGHILPGMRKHYVEQIEGHKLLAVAERLRSRLGAAVIRNGEVEWVAGSAASSGGAAPTSPP